MARNKNLQNIDFSKLQTSLVNSGIQKENNALFQTLNQLIENLTDYKASVDAKFAQLGITE